MVRRPRRSSTTWPRGRSTSRPTPAAACRPRFRPRIGGRAADATMWGSGVIRDATGEDWPAIWSFLREIVAAGDTYAYDPDLSEARARETWLLEPPARTAVAAATDGTILGSAK